MQSNNNNIPKLPNDIIFYILKLNRLEKSKNIQKKLLKESKVMRETIKEEYPEDYGIPKDYNWWKQPMGDVICELYNLQHTLFYGSDEEDYDNGNASLVRWCDQKGKDYLYQIYRERWHEWIYFNKKPKGLKKPNWMEKLYNYDCFIEDSSEEEDDENLS